LKILGISAYYHDSAAAIICDGNITAACQEERFTRKKHDPSFPTNAVSFCLKYSGLSLKDLDAVVFYEKPWLKFERLLQTYYDNAPDGARSFLASMPVWIKEKFFQKSLILEELRKLEPGAEVNLLFSEHHLSHAASAFYPSPFEKAAILTIDGAGEWATASIGFGEGNKITLLKELKYPDSVGLLYSAFTYYLGFTVNSGEYKLMGLSPYGDPGSKRFSEYYDKIKNNIVEIKDDGSIRLDQNYFKFSTDLKMADEAKWEKLFGLKRRVPESQIDKAHCDLALAIQKVTEEIVLKMAYEAKKLTGSGNLVLAGGVALNCVANSRVLKGGIFDNIWIQPAAGDAGGALGAAYAAYHMLFDNPRRTDGKKDSMSGSYLGPEFSELDIRLCSNKYGAVYNRYGSYDLLCEDIAKRISEGQVIGWFQGRAEWGPRALGNRSILGDARSKDMQKKMNLKIKFRESFRPFAPSVTEEDKDAYFDAATDSPYMLLVADVKKERRLELPKNYSILELNEKLYYVRSDIPAVTHLDFSARLQTVSKHTNERYWKLIDSFKKLTGCPVIVNTSFNVRGEPIVCSPEDAYRCFMRTEIDCLVMGDFVFDKKYQPSRSGS
jgi:carbamoyltransferase